MNLIFIRNVLMWRGSDSDFDLYFSYYDNVWVALIWTSRLAGR